MKKRKLLTTITLSLTLLCTTFTIPTFASTSASPTISRMSGQTRYDTASAIAKQGWSQSDYAILAFGENYPDALASAPLAKKYNAPILLTASNNLPSVTKQTLIDLQTKNVFLIGGTGVISSSIDTELQSMGINVTRVFGNDKYETSIKIAQQITTTPSSIFVCTGEDYADGLSVSPIASIKQDPIILVPNDSMPDSVKNYISSNNSITKSYVIGYSDEINDTVANQFPNSERILGSDRYSRNIAVNQKFNSEFSSDGVSVASGEQFPDALSGSALAAKISSPIILVNNASPDGTKAYYQQRLANASSVNVFGGTAVVPDSIVQGLSNFSNPVASAPNTSTPITPINNIVPTTPTMSDTTQMSDVDFQNYLNQNYGSLTIDNQTVNFTWNVNKYKLNGVDNSIDCQFGINNDYITWLEWMIGNKKVEINKWFNNLNTVIAKNYPNESFMGDIIFQGEYSIYPRGYSSDEISYNFYTHKWSVTHALIGFGDLRKNGISNPLVLIN